MPQKVGSTASSLAQAKELASKCGIKLQREIRLPNVGLYEIRLGLVRKTHVLYIQADFD